MRKSWRSQGILYCAAAFLRMGLAWAQAGHSRSPNSKIATRAPGGGLSGEPSRTCVDAGGVYWAATNIGAAKRREAARAKTLTRRAWRRGIGAIVFGMDVRRIPPVRGLEPEMDVNFARCFAASLL